MKEIVIKISDETYNECQADEGRLNIIWELVDAIRKGTLLPKGHGDLKDVSNLLTVTDYDGEIEKTYVLYDEIENAPTIIEAESEGLK